MTTLFFSKSSPTQKEHFRINNKIIMRWQRNLHFIVGVLTFKRAFQIDIIM